MLKCCFGTGLEILGTRRNKRPPRKLKLTPLHKTEGYKKKKGEKKDESTKAENEILRKVEVRIPIAIGSASGF